MKPYAERSGISASDYAELCVVPAQMLSGRPVRSEGDLRRGRTRAHAPLRPASSQRMRDPKSRRIRKLLCVR